MIISYDPSTAKTLTTSASSQSLGVTIGAKETWAITCAAATYIAVGASPTATTGNAMLFCAAGATIFVDGALGANLACIQATAAGLIWTARMRRIS